MAISKLRNHSSAVDVDGASVEWPIWPVRAVFFRRGWGEGQRGGYRLLNVSTVNAWPCGREENAHACPARTVSVRVSLNRMQRDRRRNWHCSGAFTRACRTRRGAAPEARHAQTNTQNARTLQMVGGGDFRGAVIHFGATKTAATTFRSR